MSKILSVLIAAMSVFLTGAAPLGNQLTIYTEHFPPYSFMANETVTGLNTELVRLSCEKVGINCRFLLYPWLRAYEVAQKDPAAAVYSTARHALREPLFKWVGPLAHSQAYLYRLKSRPEVNPATLEDAKRFVVAVARGDVYELYLKSLGFEHGINLLGLTAKSDAVGLFLQGKVDLLIGSELVVPIWLEKYNVTPQSIEPVLDLPIAGANYLALNLAVPNETVQKLQLALDELRANGEFQRLMTQYFSQ